MEKSNIVMSVNFISVFSDIVTRISFPHSPLKTGFHCKATVSIKLFYMDAVHFSRGADFILTFVSWFLSKSSPMNEANPEFDCPCHHLLLLLRK